MLRAKLHAALLTSITVFLPIIAFAMSGPKPEQLEFEPTEIDLQIPNGDRCGAEETRAKLVEDAQHLEELRSKMQAGNRAIRIVAKGIPVTMDFSPERLNIWLDEKGNPVSISCG